VSQLDRRSFLRRAALTTIGAAGIGAGAGAGAVSAEASGTPSPAEQAILVNKRSLANRIPFAGLHQAGILTPRQDQATVIAFDSLVSARAELFETLQALSTEAQLLCDGTSVGVTEADDPPPDSGILGAFDAPDSQTVTIAFGASLFDDRYGLGALRPRHLTAMTPFADDVLDPARTGGDVLVQICAGHRDTVVHTMRELTRTVAGNLAVRWTLDGFQSAQRGPTQRSSRRNLFAFRDGTGNPDLGDERLMRELIWVGRRNGEPRWALDGTYQVIRTIRMHVEFWDRVGMLEQENMIGRYRVSGAPLGGSGEFENPDYPSDPHGRRIPLTAHIRVANPRTPRTADQRIVRRGYNYHRGVDEADDLDQGLLFIAFNQDLERQYVAIQNRLEGEPMIDYITPVGGGYFFAPRGATGLGDWVGSGLARALT
jgi:deferrochelatase/peroxidase EfeB